MVAFKCTITTLLHNSSMISNESVGHLVSNETISQVLLIIAGSTLSILLITEISCGLWYFIMPSYGKFSHLDKPSSLQLSCERGKFPIMTELGTHVDC